MLQSTGKRNYLMISDAIFFAKRKRLCEIHTKVMQKKLQCKQRIIFCLRMHFWGFSTYYDVIEWIYWINPYYANFPSSQNYAKLKYLYFSKLPKFNKQISRIHLSFTKFYAPKIMHFLRLQMPLLLNAADPLNLLAL